ncbi:SDR family oxidoreductase [Flavihumibacter petaseus]|uniref:Putative oxidoreductase n=1 Tax=Flavihumibacter petaseus NBRC 106054 TaxID=1220578 RepID=A0A0E9N0J2_9BACT|nr:SDR family NAD(P)-dependent oxidoreductase [Flavihumibacter petaseus]GAO42870.1 putative oxidoreductase [Flavihumibacter petaseus NBRC 106054]
MLIVITGASRGIGKAIAEKFASPENTLLLCSRSETNLYRALQDLQEAFPQTRWKARPADLSVPNDIKEFAEWVLEQGIPDIIVNNAGQFIPGSVHNEPDGALEAMLQQNLLSAYHLTRYLLPAMMARKSGMIFNICSIASMQAYHNGGAYGISKHALLGFSRNLREEMKPFGIRVTAVIPGAAYTDSWEGAGIDRNRLMEASDIATMVFAASTLTDRACVEDIVLRPQLGDL